MLVVMIVEVGYGMGKYVYDIELKENFFKMFKVWYFFLIYYDR